ncbi:MAG: cytochrome C [Hyphomicrobium sp.]|nr:cytochrome C [Hyphomicrobium sp.]
MIPIRTRTVAILVSFIVVALTAMTELQAQSLFEKLILPGEVVTPHAKFEQKCETCHEPFSKSSQRRLCLDCHKDVASDIAGKRGFHGKRPEIATTECKTCHTDHKGRGADIVPFDEATFNHAFTDFELAGAHKSVPCANCHASGKPFRAAPGKCVDCHKSDDAHRGNLGTDCASCHREEDWRKPKAFDHTKTAFPLEGAHAKVACAACHAGERYKPLPHACVDCHKIQDVHAGRFGAKCEKCHAPSKWKTIRFDHDKNTKFPLNGAHEAAACTSCHRSNAFEDKLATTCISCHKEQDPHKGALGTKCQTCHNETAWQQKVAFDHELSRFPLIGLHAVVPCEECHRSTAFRGTPMNCSACHDDKHHQGALGPDCKRCHNPNGWTLWRFDHDRETSFPLTGTHRAITCDGCHKPNGTAKATAPTSCFGCHASDDAHRGSFGRACDKCHSTDSFRASSRAP